MSWGFRYSVGVPAGGRVAPGGFLPYHCSCPQDPATLRLCQEPRLLAKAPRPHVESLGNQPSSSLLITRWELPGCPPPAAKEEREIKE